MPRVIIKRLHFSAAFYVTPTNEPLLAGASRERGDRRAIKAPRPGARNRGERKEMLIERDPFRARARMRVAHR